MADNKAPYKIPSMVDIKEIQPNGFNAISTFSGCGGSSLGYRMAGFKVLWASEFIPAAQDTYNANKATYTILDNRDIRDVSPQDILEAISLGVGDLDLFDGSPPCASFSTAGKRESGWGEVKKYSDSNQRTDDLFFEYIRLVKGTQPKVFIAENVSGLVKGTAKGYFIEIIQELKKCGYQVRAKLLDAQWLGVPQARQRIIFIGTRNDLNMRPRFPKPLQYRYTVKDALPNINKCEIGGGFGNVKFLDADKTVYQTVGTSPSSGNGLATKIETISGEKRKFTIPELKRICGFPDDFILTGSEQQQWERLGRAVPPIMMYHIAATVRDNILNKSLIGF